MQHICKHHVLVHCGDGLGIPRIYARSSSHPRPPSIYAGAGRITAVMWLRIGCIGDCQIHRGLNNSGVANSSARNGCSIKLALLDRLGNHFLIHPLTLVLASKGAAKYMRARHQTLAHTKDSCSYETPNSEYHGMSRTCRIDWPPCAATAWYSKGTYVTKCNKPPGGLFVISH
jgi:hypothetical protein